MLDALCEWAAERPWLSNLIASREDFAGTVQDIIGGVTMVGFLVVFLVYLPELAR